MSSPVHREEIAAARRAWVEAVNAGDAEAFVAPLAEDVVWLPAGPVALQGRHEILDWLRGPFEQFRFEYSVQNVRLRVAGDRAVEVSDFESLVEGADGGDPRAHRGTYTMLWIRSRDGWKIERYVDHTGLEAE